MSANQVALWYLVASVSFILALKGLSHPSTARRGNFFGIVGMAIAVVVTLALVYSNTKNVGMILAGIAVGAVVGAVIAKRVAMTQMPELVAAFHSLVGLAAVLIAVAAINNPVSMGLPAVIPTGNKLELFLGTFIGAITFSGSVIAFGKLSGRISGAPVVFKGQHLLNLALGIAMIGFGVWFFLGGGWVPFLIMTALAFLLGVLIIIPIGGADMPVVISMLNAFTGLSAAGAGFVLDNTALIIAGSLVGSSGTLLTLMMGRAMNRSLANVLFSAFGATVAGPAGTSELDGDRSVREATVTDVATMLAYADKVIVVPGYGLAVAQAQHTVKELATELEKRGVEVLYAIHPVAGRMPGHMNVLLAEADVPYPQLKEMDEINPEFPQTDVALVIGANDVTNPAARHDTSSPIFGMPILDVDKAASVIVMKRSMNPGFAGIDNELYLEPQTTMLFGDAKDSVVKLIAAVKQT